eukprot:CAMPEP_0114553276 /NCGR_PEP_ID=MMETSP0114-20121206/7567_1 /TAXON_ID=31324 /ORGANISM="Goniomonas sp, Strain m" /LENGTH=76 /DNA_ID=CAMNT_0001738199 /DNA_START=178 /DNA_END=408 /DNA_ORIENTATION=-
MKDAWESLGTTYQDHSSVVIGDVDCTVHQGLCQKNGIRGYPTIKYFPAGSTDGEDYNGGRSVGALKGFVAGKGHTA